MVNIVDPFASITVPPIVAFTACEATLVLPATSVAVAVTVWVPPASASGREAPGAACVRGCGAEHGGAVEQLDGAARLRGAGELHLVGIDDACCR